MMSPTQAFSVKVFDQSFDEPSTKEDLVITEDPLTIEIEYGSQSGRRREIFSTTMRTPGNDLELSTGLLMAEGIINGPQDIISVKEECPKCDDEQGMSKVLVSLIPEKTYNPNEYQRNLLVSSSCGLCGKIDLSKIQKLKNKLDHAEHPRMSNSTSLNSECLIKLAEEVRGKQLFFRHTGAVHASALFDKNGNILCVREDVGRHNAMDKTIGALLHSENIRSQMVGVFFSGRTSYELIQKSIVADIQFVVSVGAPSSLAINLAETAGITLAGFLKTNRYNVYTHPDRIRHNASLISQNE